MCVGDSPLKLECVGAQAHNGTDRTVRLVGIARVRVAMTNDYDPPRGTLW